MNDEKFPRSAEEWRREALRLADENEALRQENDRLKALLADAKPAVEPPAEDPPRKPAAYAKEHDPNDRITLDSSNHSDADPAAINNASAESDIRAQTRHWINRITEAAADNFKIPQELIDGLHQWMSGQSREALPVMLREVERINAKLKEVGLPPPEGSLQARVDALEKRTGRLYSRYEELRKAVNDIQSVMKLRDKP